MLDIIIPAYNAHDTIKQTLSSIAMQDMIKDIKVTIVNDCSIRDYSEEIAIFKPLMDIQEITLTENRGPGVARQTGIDNTTGEIITFIDADDVFLNSWCISIAYEKIIENPKLKNVITNFVEEVKPEEHFFVEHNQDNVWVFGKFYKRSFLEEKGIRFLDSRANEDNGFNQLNQVAMENFEENMLYLDVFTYCWKFKENSITRIDDGEYTYTCVTGYVDNVIYSISQSLEKNYGTIKTIDLMCSAMTFLYGSYVEILSNPTIKDEEKRKYYMELNLEGARRFYNTIYKQFENTVVLKERLPNAYEGTLNFFYDLFHKTIVPISYPEFIKILQNKK